MNGLTLRSSLGDLGFPILSENPLAVLARTDPPAATNLMHRILDQQENQLDISRLMTLSSISRDHSNMICGWLANRQPGEKCAMVETCQLNRDTGYLFPRGQLIRATTTFRIW